MAFFGPRPGEPVPEPDPGSPPAWIGPGPATFSVPVPLAVAVAGTGPYDERVLAHSSRALVVLRQLRAYPQGVLLEVTLAVRRTDPDTPIWPTRDAQDRSMTLPGPGQPLPDELMRFGIDYRDGHTTTDLDTAYPGYPWPAEPPQAHVLHRLAGGGGNISAGSVFQWDQPLWLWPLPPAHPFDLVLEWPSCGIGLTRVELDGTAITTAASHAGHYWPDPDVRGSTPSTTKPHGPRS